MPGPIRSRRLVRLDPRVYHTGSFFITVCTRERQRLLATIVDCQPHLTRVGEIVKDEWLTTPMIRPTVTIGEWVIMPDHFHGVVHLSSQPGRLDTDCQSLASMVRGFKAACTRRYQLLTGSSGSMWQRNYYEHGIRSKEDLHEITEYIRANPYRWMGRHM
jgi:putative transposase